MEYYVKNNESTKKTIKIFAISLIIKFILSVVVAFGEKILNLFVKKNENLLRFYRNNLFYFLIPCITLIIALTVLVYLKSLKSKFYNNKSNNLFLISGLLLGITSFSTLTLTAVLPILKHYKIWIEGIKKIKDFSHKYGEYFATGVFVILFISIMIFAILCYKSKFYIEYFAEEILKSYGKKEKFSLDTKIFLDDLIAIIKNFVNEKQNAIDDTKIGNNFTDDQKTVDNLLRGNCNREDIKNYIVTHHKNLEKLEKNVVKNMIIKAKEIRNFIGDFKNNDTVSEAGSNTIRLEKLEMLLCLEIK